MRSKMLDRLVQRDSDLVTAEDKLLPVNQDVDLHKQQCAELKRQLKHEKDLRLSATLELSRREKDIQYLSQKCLTLDEKLAESVNKLSKQRNMANSSAEKIALADQERKHEENKRTLLEGKCHRLNNQLVEERRNKKSGLMSNNLESDSQIEDLREKNSALIMQVKLAKSEIGLQQSKVQSLERRCRQLRENVSESQTETRCSNDFADEVEEKNKNLSEQLKKTKEVLETQEGEMEILRNKIQHFEKQDLGSLSCSNDKFSDLQKSNILLKEEQELVTIENRVLRDEVLSLKQKCCRHEDELKEARISNEKLELTQRDIHIKESELQFLKKKCFTYETKLTEDRVSNDLLRELQESKLSLGKELTRVEKERNMFQERAIEAEGVSMTLPPIEKLQEQNEVLKEEVKKLKSMSATTQGQAVALIRASLRSEVDQLETKIKIESNGLSIVPSDSSIVSQKKYDILAAELEIALKKITELSQSLQEAVSCNEKLQLDLQKSRKDAVAIDGKVAGNRCDCGETPVSIDEQLQSLQNLNSRNEQLLEKVVTLQKELSIKNCDNEKLQLHIVDLQQTLSEKETSLMGASAPPQENKSHHTRGHSESDVIKNRSVIFQKEKVLYKKGYLTPEMIKQDQLAMAKIGKKHKQKNSRENRQGKDRELHCIPPLLLERSKSLSSEKRDNMPPIPMHIQIVDGGGKWTDGNKELFLI